MEPSPDCAAFIRRFNTYLEESEAFLMDKGLNRHMEFLWAVEGLREKDEKESPPFIRKIYNTYFHHINLSERVQIEVEKRIANHRYELNIFDAAVEEVWRFLDLVFVSEFPLPHAQIQIQQQQQQKQQQQFVPFPQEPSSSSAALTFVKFSGENNLQYTNTTQPLINNLLPTSSSQPNVSIVERVPVISDATACVQDFDEAKSTTSELDEKLIVNEVDDLPTNPSQQQTFTHIEKIKETKEKKIYEIAQELTEKLVALKRERQGLDPSHEVIHWERKLKLERHDREQERKKQERLEQSRKWHLDQERRLRRKEKEERQRKRLSEKHMATFSGRDLAQAVRAQLQNITQEDIPPDDILDDHLSRCWSDISPERFSPPTRVSNRHSRSTGGSCRGDSFLESTRGDSHHVNIGHRPPVPAPCPVIVNKEPAHSRMSKSQTFPSNSRHNYDSGISTITMSTSTSRTTRDEESSGSHSMSASSSSKNKKKEVKRVYYQDIL